MLFGVDGVLVVRWVGEFDVAVFVLALLGVDVFAFLDRCHDGAPFETHSASRSMLRLGARIGRSSQAAGSRSSSNSGGDWRERQASVPSISDSSQMMMAVSTHHWQTA